MADKKRTDDTQVPNMQPQTHQCVVCEKEDGSLMCGKCFYDRFEKEVQTFNYEHRGGVEISWSDYLEEAAKKASGI